MALGELAYMFLHLQYGTESTYARFGVKVVSSRISSDKHSLPNLRATLRDADFFILFEVLRCIRIHPVDRLAHSGAGTDEVVA